MSPDVLSDASPANVNKLWIIITKPWQNHHKNSRKSLQLSQTMPNCQHYAAQNYWHFTAYTERQAIATEHAIRGVEPEPKQFWMTEPRAKIF